MAVEISTAQDRLDLDWITRQLQGSYWGSHLRRPTIERAVARSLCFGAYDARTVKCDKCNGEPAEGFRYCEDCKGLGVVTRNVRQVGFVRTVTDGSIFSSVTDVIVQEDMRGKGIGTALMTAAMNHPDIAGTICILRARPAAQIWYFKNWGFQLLDRQHGIMYAA